MMAQRGVRFADSLPRPSTSPQPQWHVPSFGAKVVPPPPPPPPPPKKPEHANVLQSIFSATPDAPKECLDTVVGTPSATPKKSPPKLIHAGGGERFFSSQSASAILSPISAMTEVTEIAADSPVVKLHKFRRPPHRPLHEEERHAGQTTVQEEESAPMSTSFETLNTIDMLNFGFVNKCECAKDLGKVIRLLAEKKGSPQLLQAARKRLQVVQGKTFKAPPPPPPPRRPLIAATDEPSPQTVADEEEIPLVSPVSPPGAQEEEEDCSPGQFFTDSTANISRITVGNTTLDSIDASRNSLNFSYSPPSVLRGLQLVDTPNQSWRLQDSAVFSSDSRGKRLGTISEGSSSSQQNTPQTESTAKERLMDEVNKLTGQAMEMESVRHQERSKFMEKLRRLQRAKKEAENLVRTLETKVEVVTSQKEETLKAMERIQLEQHQMRQALQQEQARLQEKDLEARDLETRMQQKIAELQSALKEEVERSRLAVGAEKKLRLQSESDLELQRERNVELNQLLRQTRENLERIKRTQESFRAELIRAIGVDESEFQKLSQMEVNVELAKKVKAMKEENTTLAQELEEARAAPNQLVEERDRLERRMREMLRQNKVLEDENVTLGGRIEELSAEVISSRTYIDKLLRTTHDTHANEWDIKEAQYKAAIRNYQQQIRKQASTVSLELYKKAVDENKRTQTQLDEAAKKIQNLETKVSTLKKNEPAPLETKTPLKTYGTRNMLMSPTDFLEKGLLSMNYPREEHRLSPSHYVCVPSSSLKNPKTPTQRISFDVRATARKSTTWADSGYMAQHQSPVDTAHVHKNNHGLLSEGGPSHCIEEPTTPRNPQHAGHENLIGMTISIPSSFQNGQLSPRESDLQSPLADRASPFATTDINDWVDQYAKTRLSSAEKNGRSTPKGGLHGGAIKGSEGFRGLENSGFSPSWRPTPHKRTPNSVKKVVVSGSPSANTPAKENQAPFTSPQSGSKTLRMRKARELGGMKGLKNQLNKIRSPQSLGKPKRVPNVLGNRQVNN